MTKKKHIEKPRIGKPRTKWIKVKCYACGKIFKAHTYKDYFRCTNPKCGKENQL
jgi:hypothetical protein